MEGAHLHRIEAKQFYFFEWFIICLHGNEIEEDERIGRCFLGRIRLEFEEFRFDIDREVSPIIIALCVGYIFYSGRC